METGFFSMTIVQIAISIVISWALFSLLCSMIHEIMVQIKSERGRFFRTKILQKLYDPTNQINWGIMIYDHSKIKLLTKSSEAPPSEISSKTFAETLVDSVAFAQVTQIAKNKQAFNPNFSNNLLNDFEFAVNNLGQSDVINMLRLSLNKAKIRASNSTGIEEEKVYSFLIEDIQIWFDEFGSRTSLWYKKSSQIRLFILGIIIAAIMNIDSIALIQYYKENPTVRAGIIGFYTKNKIELEELSNKYKILDSIASTQSAPVTAVAQNDSTTTEQPNTPEENTAIPLDSTKIKIIRNDIAKLSKQIDTLKQAYDLPIGWDKAVCESKTAVDDASQQDKMSCHCTTNTVTFSCALFKILGLLISALAASLGAPFWFDLLKKATTTSIVKK